MRLIPVDDFFNEILVVGVAEISETVSATYVFYLFRVAPQLL